MIEVHSKALDQSTSVGRVIGHLKGTKPGPTLIFMGGIHGNEPSGVFALQKVFKKLEETSPKISGNIYGITGNMWALERGVRFDKEDLNRVWFKERINALPKEKEEAKNEDIKQQMEIYEVVSSILEKEEGPFYFFDLHTTSSETVPFLTVNDSLLNRKFTIQYPLPIILGIEEYLEGPILSYINELGYVAFGFEAGQHDSLASIENNMAFIYLSLVFTGIVNKEDIQYHQCYDLLAKTTGDVRNIYEIYFRYLIKPEESFKMNPGFFNFQRVRAEQELAISNGKSIRALKDGRIFMPLYQSQGSDGFFAIRKIPSIFLLISSFLRKIRMDKWLTILPGVKWKEIEKHTLIVNKRIALFFAKQFFHLLGYRSKRLDRNHYFMENREEKSRDIEYEKETWYLQ